MCEKCDALANDEGVKEEIYTLYFIDGRRIVLKGKNFSEGWNKAQAASKEVMNAKDIEWMDIGETDTHHWLIEVKSWLNRQAQTFTNNINFIEDASQYYH